MMGVTKDRFVFKKKSKTRAIIHVNGATWGEIAW